MDEPVGRAAADGWPVLSGGYVTRQTLSHPAWKSLTLSLSLSGFSCLAELHVSAHPPHTMCNIKLNCQISIWSAKLYALYEEI